MNRLKGYQENMEHKLFKKDFKENLEDYLMELKDEGFEIDIGIHTEYKIFSVSVHIYFINENEIDIFGSICGVDNFYDTVKRIDRITDIIKTTERRVKKFYNAYDFYYNLKIDHITMSFELDPDHNYIHKETHIKEYNKWILEKSVGMSKAMTVGNSKWPNQANLANARKYVEELAAKDRKKLFKLANLQSGKSLSWSEWKWNVDKAMDIVTRYLSEHPEEIKMQNDQIETFPVPTNYVPYTNNIGGVYRQNGSDLGISQIRSVRGDNNALGPNIVIN